MPAARDGWPPWLWPLVPWIVRLQATGGVAQRLNALRQAWCGPDATAAAAMASGLGPSAQRAPPWFVPADTVPPAVAYEAHIARTGEVPTRDNAHDLLNGLVWLVHTPLKWRLNALQAEDLALRGVGAHRGPLRDALTLMDENGAWWPDPDPVLLKCWQARQWTALCVDHRDRWPVQGLWIVGHALLESLLMAPRKGLTAHVLTDAHPLQLQPAAWATKPFLPLPVCGVPGWWPDQAQTDFYEDTKVFRPPRNLKPPTGP